MIDTERTDPQADQSERAKPKRIPLEPGEYEVDGKRLSINIEQQKSGKIYVCIAPVRNAG